MPKPTGYVQFPLCSLAVGASNRERFIGILSHWAEVYGTRLWTKLKPPEQERLRNFLRDCPELNRSLAPQDEQLTFRAATLLRLGLSPQELPEILLEGGRFKMKLDGFKDRFGGDPEVRLRSDLFLEMFGKRQGGISFEDGAVLCGIYSVIGNKQRPVRITKSTIKHRALGYKSEKVMLQHLNIREEIPIELSDWKTREGIDRLHARKLFAKCTYGRRVSYYSNRCTDATLRQKVEDMVTRREVHKFATRMNDRHLTETIRNRRASYQGKPLPHPDSLPPVVSSDAVDAMNLD